MLKIVLLCVGLVLIFSTAMRISAYQTAKSSVEDTMGQSALSIIRSVENKVDAEKFDQLQTADDMNKVYYKELQQKLYDIKEISGLKYLYTMRKTAEGKYIYVVDGEVPDDASKLGAVEEDISDKMLLCFNGQESYELNSDQWGSFISGYVPIMNSNGDTIGILAADFEAGYMVDKLKKANHSMLIVQIILVLISIVVTYSFAYFIVHSLKHLQSKMQLVKNGDLTIKMKSNRRDEVGSLSESFQDMVDNMGGMIKNIRKNTNEVVHNINELNVNIDFSKQSTEEITKVITEIAAGASDQVESVGLVNDSMERVFNEITSITNHIDKVNNDSDMAMKDMQEVSKILNGSIKQINLVNDMVENTATMMEKLQDKFQEVLSCSNSVTAIASRTNLLALNASIEAASAGEHGKGFAVVAGEIKNLAKQSSDASKHINELIVAVQEEISSSSEAIDSGVVEARHGVDVIEQVEIYLDKLSQSNQKVDYSIKEIAKAIVHIEEDSKNVLAKTTDLTDISGEFSAGTQQTASEAEEQLAIMETIRSDLAMVKDRMEQLGMTVNRFTVD